MDFELKNPPIVEKRRLVKSGASIVLTLPKKWLEENDLEAGSEIIVVANGDIQIMKSNNENVERLNKKISEIRNQLSHSNQSVATDSNKDSAAAESG
ncbi:MAG: AbrB/MazE/SpoVT family DNA-binding domain-containing protein [Candidatus Pacearchaeota archaeon]